MPRIWLLPLLCITVTAHADDATTAVGRPVPQPATQSLPVTVIQREQILHSGFSNVGEALASLLPGLSFPRPSVAGGTDHAQPFSFRGFAPDQIAVTVNGRPWHKSSVFHRNHTVGHGSLGVDLNLIPIAAIERIEVLRDGASDQYGSGAIGAVVDIVLDESSRGTFVSASYSRFRTTVDGVPKFFGVVPERTEFVLFEVEGRGDPIDDGDGDTAYVAASVGTDIFDTGFLRLSADYRRADATQRSGRDPRFQYEVPPDEFYDPREIFIDRRNHRFGNTELKDFAFLTNLMIPIGARYAFSGHVGTSVRSARSGDLYRRAVDERNVLELYPDGFLPLITSDIDDRYAALEFSRRGEQWDWSLSMSQGEDEIDWTVRQTLNTSFGAISPTRLGAGNNESRNQLWNISVERQWQGQRPIELLLAVEHLTQEYENEIGEYPATAAGGEPTAGGAPAEIGVQGFEAVRPIDDFDVSENSSAVFAVATLEPLRKVEILLGARYTDHSEAGGVWSGRMVGKLDATEKLTLRAGIGRHFRAPALAQSHFTESRLVDDGATFTERGIYGIETAPAAALGGTTLEHEISNNVSMGIVARPAERLSISFDLYAVDVTDRVGLSDELTGAILQGVPGTDTSGVEAVRFSLNAFDTRTVGADLSTRYDFSIGANRLDLWLGLNVNDVEVRDVRDDTLTGRQASLRIERGSVDSKLHLGVRWSRQRFFWNVGARRYGEVLDAGESAEEDFALAAKWVLDSNLGYAFNDAISLSFGINNLLDTYPDAKPRNSVANRILPFSNFSPFGFNGREVWLRLDAGLR